MVRSRFRYTGFAVVSLCFMVSSGFAQQGAPSSPGSPALEPRIEPQTTRVLVGMSRQFRAVGTGEVDIQWAILDCSEGEDDVGEIDQNGLFTAQSGGWVIIGVVEVGEDGEPVGDPMAQTDTIWTMGGPTRIGPHRGGRAFSADERPACVQFPAQAHERAMTVLIEKRGQNELPEQAQGRGTAVAIFQFTATESETGADVGGGEGFDQPVQLTLPYDEGDLPPDTQENRLVVGFLNEVTMRWQVVPPTDVIEVDREANTITVRTNHASYWAVLDGDSVDGDVPTAAERSSWGRIKGGLE